MKKSQQGFTLIELMIVVAIIGILAAIAMPAYSNYVKKSKFTEIVLATSTLKSQVEVCVLDLGTLTGCSSGSYGIFSTAGSGNLSSIDVVNGLITATAVGAPGAEVNGLEGETYILNPTLSNGRVLWDTTTGSCVAASLC